MDSGSYFHGGKSEEEVSEEKEEFHTLEEEEVKYDEEEPTEEKEEKEDIKNYFQIFPVEIMKDTVKDVVKKYKIPGINDDIVDEFNTLLDERKFLRKEVKITDKKVIEVVKNMIRKTSIPGPGDELYNDLYKVLVKNLSSDLKESDTNELDAEVTARKLAAWVLSFDEELKNQPSPTDEQVEAHMPDNPYYYRPAHDGAKQEQDKEDRNVKLYNLSEQNSKPYWQAPGEVIQLKDQEGSQIYVKGLMGAEGNRTIVKKIKRTNNGKEVSSWIVEVPDREQAKSVEANIKSFTDVIEKPKTAKLRNPATTDDWKTVADIRKEEAKKWKNVVGSENESDKEDSKPKGKSKSRERRQPELKNPRVSQQKSNDPKYLMNVADLKKSLKNFRKVDLKMDLERESYLVNEMKKRHDSRTKNEDSKYISSAAKRKIRST
ncbi:uncharacterized protein PF3D7_1120000 isoform X2 [Halyomorpha halys]|uniref:uncharacterized protein PF3D7_1120000 isoform X2 n=1 Tax=Halyomorpha halys TaxID=286706 RepID=UPI0006D4FC56|nr:myb-like protein X isoform X2 [Halyomorpha halys]